MSGSYCFVRINFSIGLINENNLYCEIKNQVLEYIRILPLESILNKISQYDVCVCVYVFHI